MKRWLIAALFSSSLVILAESVSYKNFTTPPAPGAPRVVTPDKTVSYGGFQIQPMPGMKWGIAPGKGQRENMAWSPFRRNCRNSALKKSRWRC